MIPQLNFVHFFSQIFWLAITFSVLYGLLTYHFLPKIRHTLYDRKTRILSEIERAESLRNDTRLVLAQLESAMQSARHQAETLHQETTIRLQQEAATRHAALQAELDQQWQDAEARLAVLQEQLSDKAASMAQTLANAAVEKIEAALIYPGDASGSDKMVAGGRR